MPDFRIYPATATLSTTGSANMIGSGSTTNPTIFSVNGNNGRLLEVTDDLSDSIFSANTIAGLPVIEAFANNCVVLGQYSGHQLRVTCTSIAGGKCATASGAYSIVAGGKSNTASSTYTTVAGGCSNLASANLATVGGGVCNRATAGWTTIAGGFFNQASGSVSAVGGGESNYAGDSWATVAGGISNYAYNGESAFVGGGRVNCARNVYATITGGNGNDVQIGFGFIGGGFFNLNCGCVSTIAGGQQNQISATGGRGFIGGGLCNSVSAAYGAVLGGRANTASGAYSTTSGGYLNCATGIASGILGGYNNKTPGNYSSAAGCGITASSACYFYANNICNVSGGTSDCRMKHSICPITYNLDQITKLKPTSFVFNGDCSNFRRYGFIAQEVCQVIPDIITHHPIDKIDSKGNVGGNVVGDPVLQFEKDAVFASYVNAFKELKGRLELVEAILKNNNLM